MSLGVVLLAVAGGWFLVGLAFWAVLIGRGYHFEFRGTALPRVRRTSLTLTDRDASLAAVREKEARKAALLN